MARYWKVLAVVVVLAGVAWTAVRASMDNAPALATAEVTRGTYVDRIEIRGEVRPVRSLVVTAPADAGELLILTLAKNGTDVKKGDVVAQFDAITLRRTVQERQSELRQATAEMNQTMAQSRITEEQQATSVMRATFDVQRAELGLVDTGLISEVESERAKLALDDAKQRLAEAQAAAAAAKSGSAADVRGRQRRIDKVQADLDRANKSLGALEMIAPADGTVNILPNFRSATPMGGAQEFRAGDRTFPMAQILELPDLTSVHLTARIDEADRGQLKPGLVATIRADAVPDREYTATITDVSVLARVDFNSGWPPAKMFDLKLTFSDVDDRLRPGMSAVARIPVGELKDVLLVPAQAVFNDGGRSVVYIARGRSYVATEVQVLRRGREQVALSGGVSPGDRVALVSPVAAPGGPGGPPIAGPTADGPAGGRK
jgi:multidrug efflux pump subunit AcrA (membrane-fusion protein)